VSAPGFTLRRVSTKLRDTSFARIRDAKPSDVAFISESWRCWNKSSTIGELMGRLYHHDFKRHVAKVLQWPSITVKVAVSLDDDDAIMGFAVMSHVNTDRPRLHYVFVRPEARQLGLGKALISDLFEKEVLFTSRPKRVLLAALPQPPRQWTFSLLAGVYEDLF
jgi:GNAT superfamily N-acetyltransferase